MPTALRHPEPVTIEGFDAFIDAQADTADFELIEGVIFMMTNPTETHEQIASNIGAPMKLAMDKRGCRSYQGGMRVQASDDSRGTDKYKPDIVVRCGSVGKKNDITDPLVVVEILSPEPSTTIAAPSSTSTRHIRLCATSRSSIRIRCASNIIDEQTKGSNSKRWCARKRPCTSRLWTFGSGSKPSTSASNSDPTRPSTNRNQSDHHA